MHIRHGHMQTQFTIQVNECLADISRNVSHFGQTNCYAPTTTNKLVLEKATIIGLDLMMLTIGEGSGGGECVMID
jgi:hypothetical protein